MKRANHVMVLLLGVLFLWALMPAGMEVGAQEKPIELTYASQYANIHPYSLADQHWIAKIEKETNGRVKIKPYWAGTLTLRKKAYVK